MRRRQLLALAAFALLSVTAGCLGPGSISAEQLDEEPAEAYAWESERDAHIVVQTDSSFRAVYNVSEQETELFRRDGFGGRNPLNVRALRYRYPNGTVVDGSELEARGGEVRRTREVVRVTLPPDASGGELAFTAGATPKRFSLPTFVTGSYEVVLPENRRVGVPVFGTVSPRGYETSIDEAGRTHIRWDEVTARSVSVQYYLQRDLGIFAAVAAIAIVVGGTGAYRYKRQIEALREQREDLGLDVDVDDDEFDDGPPPGMR